MAKTFPAAKDKAAVSLAVLAGMTPFNVLLVMAPFNKALLLSLWGLLHPCLPASPPRPSPWEQMTSWQ